MKPYYLIRATGGALYLLGALFMAFNIWMTIRGKLRDEAPLTGAAYDEARDRPVASDAAAPGYAIAAE